MHSEAILARIQATSARIKAEKEQLASTLPASEPCQHHPQILRLLDLEESWYRGSARFQSCAICVAEQKQREEIKRLQEFGVPLNLCNATLENWMPGNESEAGVLAKVREFAAARRGFLVLLGGLGTGKSHLATAVLRTFERAWFVKQSDLLRRLRQTYRDRDADDPVDRAQYAGCLVLDEIGLSAGGRDEPTLLHDVLDHRHGNQKPTILTGNLKYEELLAILGERLADRLQESGFAALSLGGASHRREARERYFQPRMEHR